MAAGEDLLVAGVALFVGPRVVGRQSLPPVIALLRREPVEEFDPFGDPAQPNRLLSCECGEQSTLLALGRQVEVAVTREGAGDVTWDAYSQLDHVPGCAAPRCRDGGLEQRVGVRALARTFIAVDERFCRLEPSRFEVRVPRGEALVDFPKGKVDSLRRRHVDSNSGRVLDKLDRQSPRHVSFFVQKLTKPSVQGPLSPRASPSTAAGEIPHNLEFHRSL